jgi:Mrp family chromosome partitioning ATPase
MKLAGIDGAVVITTPQEIAMADVRKEISFCQKVGIRILGVVENMSGLDLPFNCDQVKFTSAEDGTDITLRVRDAVEKDIHSHARASSENMHDPCSIRIHIDVFPASRGGALKMCEGAGVKYLGSLPLDPAIAIASEKGHSLFSRTKTSTGSNLHALRDSSTVTSLNSVIDALLSELGGA